MEPLRVITRRSFLATGMLVAGGIVAARALRSGSPADRSTVLPVHADDLVESRDGDRLTLTPRRHGASGAAPVPVYRLNATAALIWRTADGSRTTDEIAAHVAAVCAIPSDRARRDTQRCLLTLERAGLVTAARA